MNIKRGVLGLELTFMNPTYKVALTPASTLAGDSSLGFDSIDITLMRMDSMLCTGRQRSDAVS